MWDGGTARQIGLVDQFGDLNDAVAWVAKRAGIEGDDYHARFLGSEASEYQTLLRQLFAGNDRQARIANDLFAVTAQRQAALPAQVAADMQGLMGRQGAQAYCLSCPAGRPTGGTMLPGGQMDALTQVLRALSQ